MWVFKCFFSKTPWKLLTRFLWNLWIIIFLWVSDLASYTKTGQSFPLVKKDSCILTPGSVIADICCIVCSYCFSMFLIYPDSFLKDSFCICWVVVMLSCFFRTLRPIMWLSESVFNYNTYWSMFCITQYFDRYLNHKKCPLWSLCSLL